ncbi:hypothetical protein ANN_14263 [Periplaneta americana]|uniref:Uncharacterized protein n=1 Tax=Periplaneta americana TaxID=6978 RepID=A0ABQ8SX19_PERAM|nr:hypothetical protein ANN_14263 [Periplaneta americana]
MLLVSSDPLISSLRKLPVKKSGSLSPQVINLLLPSPPVSSLATSEASGNLSSEMDIVANFRIPKEENRVKITATKASRQLNNHLLSQKTSEWREFENHIKENDIELAAITLEKTIQSAKTLHTAKSSKTPEDLRYYSQTRKEYKDLLKAKRKEYMEQEATKMVKEAKKDPYIALRPRRAQSSGKMDLRIWKNTSAAFST